MRDHAGNEYFEVATSSTDFLRVTAITRDSGYPEPSYRLQIRGADGRLRLGPEIPTRVWATVLARMSAFGAD